MVSEDEVIEGEKNEKRAWLSKYSMISYQSCPREQSNNLKDFEKMKKVVDEW